MLDPGPPSDIPRDVMPIGDLPRMTVEEARVVMNKIVNLDAARFTNAASFQEFYGFVNALGVLATHIFINSNDITKNEKAPPDFFIIQKADGNQNTKISLKYSPLAAKLLDEAKDDKEQSRVLTQNTPTAISVSTEDVPNHTGFNSFAFSVELQSPFPAERSEKMFVNFIKENGGPNAGINYPPLFNENLTPDHFQTIARGVIRCAELISSWEKSLTTQPVISSTPRLSLAGATGN